jgi:RNA polymerase subunit RPABC4/transcription elongation factor Spt4
MIKLKDKKSPKEKEKEKYDICPDCGKKSVKAKWSGIACITKGCGYWFCY